MSWVSAAGLLRGVGSLRAIDDLFQADPETSASVVDDATARGGAGAWRGLCIVFVTLATQARTIRSGAASRGDKASLDLASALRTCCRLLLLQTLLLRLAPSPQLLQSESLPTEAPHHHPAGTMLSRPW